MFTCLICEKSECICPPCRCMWCRHRRGEDLSPDERRAIEARDRAIKKDALRKSLRENPIRLRRPGAANT